MEPKDWLLLISTICGILGAVALFLVLWRNQSFAASERVIKLMETEAKTYVSKAERFEDDYKELVKKYQEQAEAHQLRIKELTAEHQRMLEQVNAEYQKVQLEFKEYRDRAHAEREKAQAILIENTELKAYSGPIWTGQLKWQQGLTETIDTLGEEIRQYVEKILEKLDKLTPNGRTKPPSGPSQHSDI